MAGIVMQGWGACGVTGPVTTMLKSFSSAPLFSRAKSWRAIAAPTVVPAAVCRAEDATAQAVRGRPELERDSPAHHLTRWQNRSIRPRAPAPHRGVPREGKGSGAVPACGPASPSDGAGGAPPVAQRTGYRLPAPARRPSADDEQSSPGHPPGPRQPFQPSHPTPRPHARSRPSRLWQKWPHAEEQSAPHWDGRQLV